MAVLLAIADLFSKIHNIGNLVPKYKLMFLISESGALLNFQGMKKWLDSNLDENVQIQIQVILLFRISNIYLFLYC